MDNQELITPSGHKVYLRTKEITYGEKRQLQRAMIARIKIDQKSRESVLDGTGYFDAEDLAVRMYVQKIIDKDGLDIPAEKFLETIQSWPEADGDCVYKAVNSVSTQGIALPNLPVNS